MKGIFEYLLAKKIVWVVIFSFAGWLIYKIISSLIRKIINRGRTTFEQKRRVTVVELVSNILKVFIVAIVLIICLEMYGIDTRSIVASLGIVGVVVGLALQETAQDFVKGITIITDNYYVIGDIVTINGFTGEVIEVSLKTTKIRNIAGEVLVFPNHSVGSITNLSQARAGIKLDIPVAYEEDAINVEKVLKEILEKVKKMPHVYQDSTYLGIEDFKDSAILYSMVIYCKASERWNLKREILKKIKITFEKENIKIPYTQIEVHNGKEIV